MAVAIGGPLAQERLRRRSRTIISRMASASASIIVTTTTTTSLSRGRRRRQRRRRITRSSSELAPQVPITSRSRCRHEEREEAEGALIRTSINSCRISTTITNNNSTNSSSSNERQQLSQVQQRGGSGARIVQLTAAAGSVSWSFLCPPSCLPSDIDAPSSIHDGRKTLTFACALQTGTLEQHPNETSHYDGRFVPYTFPAAAAAAPSALLPPVSSSSSSSSYSNPYAAGTSSSSSSLFNSNNPPALSSVPASAAAYTSSAHSFAGAGSPAYAQLQQQQQQANYGSSSGGPAGGGERGSLTPGSYPPMQLVPPPPPPSASADSHEQKGRGLSALSAAAAAGLGAVVAMAEEEEVGPDHQGGGGDDVRRSERRGGSFSSLSNSHPHYAYSNPYTTSSSYPYSSATAPNGSRSASPATWAAGITTTTTTTASSGSPLHFSNLRQQVSTYPRRGSEPDAYALSSPRGAAVSAIRGEQPTRPSSYSSFQPAGRGGEEGLAVVTSGIQLTTTVVSTPSNGEVSASGTTQATTPPLLGGSNGSSPQFKSAGVNNANNHHESTVGIGAMSGSAESIGRGNANANGSRTTLPEPSAAEAAAESASYLLDEFSLTPELYQILHPQYPLSLPPLSTLHHLLTTFFLRATIPSTMLSRAQILQSLVFGPADARWPEEALLHAMCAYAASFVSPDSLAGPNAHDDPMASSLLGGFDGGLSGVYARRSTYWEMEGDKNPREYHYRHAKRCILEAMGGVALPSGHRVAKRRNLLQVRVVSARVGDFVRSLLIFLIRGRRFSKRRS